MNLNFPSFTNKKILAKHLCKSDCDVARLFGILLKLNVLWCGEIHNQRLQKQMQFPDVIKLGTISLMVIQVKSERFSIE